MIARPSEMSFLTSQKQLKNTQGNNRHCPPWTKRRWNQSFCYKVLFVLFLSHDTPRASSSSSSSSDQSPFTANQPPQSHKRQPLHQVLYNPDRTHYDIRSFDINSHYTYNDEGNEVEMLQAHGKSLLEGNDATSLMFGAPIGGYARASQERLAKLSLHLVGQARFGLLDEEEKQKNGDADVNDNNTKEQSEDTKDAADKNQNDEINKNKEDQQFTKLQEQSSTISTRNSNPFFHIRDRDGRLFACRVYPKEHLETTSNEAILLGSSMFDIAKEKYKPTPQKTIPATADKTQQGTPENTASTEETKPTSASKTTESTTSSQPTSTTITATTKRLDENTAGTLPGQPKEVKSYSVSSNANSPSQQATTKQTLANMKRQEIKLDQALQKLQGVCVQWYSGGYWSYEWCHEDTMTQFHIASQDVDTARKFAGGSGRKAVEEAAKRQQEERLQKQKAEFVGGGVADQPGSPNDLSGKTQKASSGGGAHDAAAGAAAAAAAAEVGPSERFTQLLQSLGYTVKHVTHLGTYAQRRYMMQVGQATYDTKTGTSVSGSAKQGQNTKSNTKNSGVSMVLKQYYNNGAPCEARGGTPRKMTVELRCCPSTVTTSTRQNKDGTTQIVARGVGGASTEKKTSSSENGAKEGEEQQGEEATSPPLARLVHVKEDPRRVCEYTAVVCSPLLCLDQDDDEEGGAAIRLVDLAEAVNNANIHAGSTSNDGSLSGSGSSGSSSSVDGRSASAVSSLKRKPIRDILDMYLGHVCLQRKEGWWRYEFCHTKYVRQFHAETVVDTVTSQAQVVVDGDYRLGSYDTSDSTYPQHREIKHVQNAKSSHAVFVQEYTGGDICDGKDAENQDHSDVLAAEATGTIARATTVRFSCGKNLEIVKVDEDSSCHYVLDVTVPGLCDHYLFQTPVVKEEVVKCLPVSSF